MKSFAKAVILVALGVVTAGCGAASGGAARALNPSPEAAVVAVTGGEFFFAPETVRVPAGGLVRLELTNTGAIEHDFYIYGLNATGLRIPPGQHSHGGEDVAAHAEPRKMGWIEFTVPAGTRPGTYEAVCTVLGHREAGMRATVIVE